MSTVDAVASDPRGAPLRSRSSAPRWIAVAAVVGLLIVAAVLAIPKRETAREVSPVAAVSAVAAAVVLPSSSVNNVTPVPTVSGSSTNPAPSAMPNCNPKFYFENGVKHFKEECL